MFHCFHATKWNISQSCPLLIHDWVCNKSSIMGANNGAPKFIPFILCVVHVAQSFIFYVVFCRCLSFFSWMLCLSVF